jgi:membrane fusion protein, multidrug efflux system
MIALAAASAQLDGARAEVRSLQADYRQRLAELRQAEADAAFRDREYARERDLAARSIASRAGLDRFRHDAESARQRLDALREQSEVALARLGGRPDAPVETYGRFLGAQAQVDRANRELRRTRVTAPIAGIVANTERLQVGAYLQAAQPACSLVASDGVWVEANPKETDLTYLAAGNAATVSVDAYPGREWRAQVASVSPATGSEFAVLPAQNVSGNWVKVVQRVPVRLRVELPQDAPRLRAGMSAEVRIDTGHRRSLADLARGIGRWLGL